MRLPLVYGAIAFVLVACAAPAGDDAEPTQESHQAIVGGGPSPTAQDATVLVNDRGRSICSGTLIAANLVLTARHCVADLNEDSECGTVITQTPASRLTISVGPNADEREYVARGVKLYVPDSNELCSADIALLSLDSDVRGVTPAKVSFAAPSQDSVGTAVGYGGSSDERTQRSDVKVLAVGPQRYTYRTRDGMKIDVEPLVSEIVTTESTCFGDSGGPLLDGEGRVFAVASRGIDSVCRDRPTYWTTLTGHERLIRDTASAVGHPIVDTPGSSSSSGKNPTAASETPGADEDATEDSHGSFKKKKDAEKPGAVDSAGCNAAPGGARPPLAALAVIALATLRRRARRPPSPG